MTKLVILGNGFDLNYDLPTSYRKHLRKILSDIDTELFNKLDKLYFNSNIDYWSDFEAKIGNVEDLDFLHDKLDDELSIQLYQEDIHYYPPESEHYGDIFSATEDALYAARLNRIDLEERFDNQHLEDLEKLYNFIEDGFREMAIESDSQLTLKLQSNARQFNFSKDDYYITFNYTKTLEILYPEIDNKHICHIHGCAEDYEDLIFGNTKNNLDTGISNFVTQNPNYSREDISDEVTSNFNEFVDAVTYSPEQLERYNNKVVETIKKINENMVKEIQEAPLVNFLDKLNIDEVLLFGLSIGEVDVPYLEKINELFPKAKWTMSYYLSKDDDPVVRNCQKLTFSSKINFQESTFFKEFYFTD